MELVGALLMVALATSTAAAGGQEPIYSSIEAFTLRSDGVAAGIQIVDFGQNVEGHPLFEVTGASGDTSNLEVSFAESIFAFENHMSDGPLILAAAIETYRLKRYNITAPLTHEGRLIQGAFRYQKFNLSTAGEVTIQKVGVRPTTHAEPLTELPGFFECSDEDLSRIWMSGARTVQLTEIPANTIPSFWVVTEQGSLVDSLAPQGLVAAGGAGLLTYNIQFDVKPETGAFAGTVSAAFESTLLSTGSLPGNLTTGEWMTVGATVNMADIEAFTIINNERVLLLSFSQGNKFFGSFGLGTPFGHSAYYRNLVATDASNATIYSSSLTDETFLDDFGMGQNPFDTIVDGSRRDRIAYNGDLDIAIGATLASTYGTSFVHGSLNLMGSYQTLPGFFVPTAKIQQRPLTERIPVETTGLIAYSFNLVTAFAQAYMMLGDVAFAQRWAPAIMDMLTWAGSQIVDGVFTTDDTTFALDWNYYDPPQTGASSKFNMVYAYALQQSIKLLQDAEVDTAPVEATLDSLRTTIHEKLWSESLGAYVLTSNLTTGFAQDAQALAILAGVPQANGISASRLLSTMNSELLLPAGPLAFSNATMSAGFAQKISPFASSYHLRAAFEAGDAQTAMQLLKTLWAPMASPGNANYTNTFWETLNPDGTPGLGLPTSLCHGWSAGPTAELTKFVLGIRPTAPGFTQWLVQPMTLGIDWARGRQPTSGGNIQVDWVFSEGLVTLNVTGPGQGRVFLPEPLLTPASETIFKAMERSLLSQPSPSLLRVTSW